MARCQLKKSLVLGIAAWTLIASSAAQARVPPVAPASPLVAVSLYGTASSRAAVCGADCTAMAAAAAQYSGGAEARDGSQLFILLGAVAALVAAYVLLKNTALNGDGGEIDVVIPVSPG